jgi:hypothetical protein
MGMLESTVESRWARWMGYLYIQWTLDEKRKGGMEIVEKERGREVFCVWKRFSQQKLRGWQL